MSGEFKHSFSKYIFSLFFVFSGIFIAVRFSLWGIAELQSSRISSAVFSFSFVALGLLFGFLSVFIWLFNKDAFLRIADGKIDARFGFGTELHAKLRDIENAENQGKNLKLTVGGNIIWIYNLVNAKDLCRYILSRISTCSSPFNIEEAKTRYEKSKKGHIIYLIATIFAAAFLFINIGWCVFLTAGKQLADFSEFNDAVFLAFTFAEILTVIITFLFADKCGKKLEAFKLAKVQIVSVLAFERKSDALDTYPNIIAKKYFDHYTYRLIVFAPQKDVFAYMLERFDVETLSWISCYDSAKGFESLADLDEEMNDAFQDVMLTD